MSDGRATFDNLEGLIKGGLVRAVHIGKSALPQKGRFCTIDLADGGSIRGQGSTAAAAFEDALDEGIAKLIRGEDLGLGLDEDAAKLI